MEASIQTPEFVLLLASINDKLTSLLDLVETKKKKSDIKKEENPPKKEKKNWYTKKRDGTIEINIDLDSLSKDESFYYTSLLENFPNICLMDEALSYDQYKKLVLRYTRPYVKDMMMQLDNYKRIGNYKSAYKVLDRWLLRDERKPRNNEGY